MAPSPSTGEGWGEGGVSFRKPVPYNAAMPTQHLPYNGEDLGPHPHVAVIFRDQIGDFLIATPLMRGLRERFPGLTLDYLGGDRTRELEEASRLVDSRYSLFGSAEDSGLASYLDMRRTAAGPYDLALNLEFDRRAAEASAMTRARYVVGASLDADGEPRVIHPGAPIDRLWADMRWNRADLQVDYPELRSSYIGEIFCQLARVETDSARTEAPVADPPMPIPALLLCTGANRSAKLWPNAHWSALAEWIESSGLTAGLLGAAPGPGNRYQTGGVDEALIASGVIDLRGKLTLPEVAGALRLASVLVTVDSGLMHLAAAVDATTVALFGASPQRLWAPASRAVRIIEPSNPCSACEDNRFKNPDCLLPIHQCMLSVEPERVIAEVERILSQRCAT